MEDELSRAPHIGFAAMTVSWHSVAFNMCCALLIHRQETTRCSSCPACLTDLCVCARYEGRRGVLTDDIPVLVYARPLAGRKHVATSDGRVTLQKQVSGGWVTVQEMSRVRSVATTAK